MAMASRVLKANNLPGVVADEDPGEVKRRLTQFARASPGDAERARVAADLIAGHIDTVLSGEGWEPEDVRNSVVPRLESNAGDQEQGIEMTEMAKKWLGKQIKAADAKKTESLTVTSEWVKGRLEELAEKEPEDAKRYASAIARLARITDDGGAGLCVDYGVVYQPVDPMVLADRRHDDGVRYDGLWLAPQRSAPQSGL